MDIKLESSLLQNALNSVFTSIGSNTHIGLGDLVQAISAQSVSNSGDTISGNLVVTGNIQTAGNLTDGTNASSPAQIKSAVNKQYNGIGVATLSSGTSSVIPVAGILAGSKVFLMATSAAAAAITGVYISAVNAGVSFTITHSTAAGTETFNYLVF